LTTCAKSGG
jgi:hypothetical protein